ncbi:MAG: hypothetical protein PHT81_00005, partial [Endomicrobiaceae bacterium]|nr:hypothetical protein [Endomicrobiaceae bacterium]
MKIFKQILFYIVILLSLTIIADCQLFATDDWTYSSDKIFEIPEGPDFLRIGYTDDQVVTISNGPTFLKSISRN